METWCPRMDGWIMEGWVEWGGWMWMENGRIGVTVMHECMDGQMVESEKSDVCMPFGWMNE